MLLRAASSATAGQMSILSYAGPDDVGSQCSTTWLTFDCL